MSAQANVSSIIRIVRKRLGLTQQSFANRLGIALPTVSRWENERHKPSPLALYKVESFLLDMGKEGKFLLEKYFNKKKSGESAIYAPKK